MESLDDWFIREILVHEPSLMRFLDRVWQRRDELADIRQEAYTRIYEASQTNRPRNPRAFLFTTVRHLMGDRLRRERIVSIRAAGDTDFLDVLVDDLTPEEHVSAGQELSRLARAFDQLPAKCREVFWLCRIKGMSQKEAAARLGVAEKTIEKHIATGTRLLACYMNTNKLVPRKSEARGSPHVHDAKSEDEQGTH